jgi:hypothetical protein
MDVQVSVCVLELYNEVLRCLLTGKEVVLMMGPGGLLLDGAVEQVRQPLEAETRAPGSLRSSCSSSFRSTSASNSS